jgi:hypothetical protein
MATRVWLLVAARLDQGRDKGSPGRVPDCHALLRDAGAVSRRVDMARRSEDAAGNRTEGRACGTRLAPNSWSKPRP